MAIEVIGGYCPKVQHLPIGSLKVFGVNPYGESIFRVIWSESRYYLVGVAHREYDNSGPCSDATLMKREKDPHLDREVVGYKWLPLYPGYGHWVLEMWKSPFGFAGCSKEQYEILYRDPVTNLMTLGPYPERGEYCQAHNFVNEPTFSQVSQLIYLTKAGWNYTYKDHEVANKEFLEKKEKDKIRIFSDMFKDSQQAFNNKPTSVRPGKRTKEKVELKFTAQEVGLGNSTGFNTGIPR